MFKLAVLGPVVTSGFGVGGQCLTCYRARAGAHEAPCFGFGVGCLGYKPASPESRYGPTSRGQRSWMRTNSGGAGTVTT